MTKDYTVELEQVFQGPLDLLLHLVREAEVEIHEIEISKIVDGYLAYLDSLEELDIEYAGDFLVMAATLMSIKSRSLLPHEELDLEEELDPKDELIQRLLEYRRFKGVSEDLERRFLERQRQAPRGWFGELEETRQERELDLGELTVWDLFATYSRLMRETMADRPHRVAGDPRPLRFYVEHVVGSLRGGTRLSLRRLIESFGDVPEREALVGSFCALLELVRMQVIEVDQPASGADISLAIRAEHSEDIDEVVRASLFEEERVARASEGAPEASTDGSDRSSGEPESASGDGDGAPPTPLSDPEDPVPPPLD